MGKNTNPFLNNNQAMSDKSESESENLEILDEEFETSTPISNTSSQRSKGKNSLFGLFSNNNTRKKPSLDETYTHSIYETFTGFSSRLIGTSLTPGHLTREEFLKAGDYLVEVDNSWKWAFSDEKMLPEFPPDRQYLVNRGLPCFVNSNMDLKERVHLDLEQNELWTLPESGGNSSVLHFYDISLTFDPNNRTPRIWLMGYNKDGNPLRGEEIIGDMAIDFVGTVATLIPHPVTGILNVSVHPCRHAEVMNRLIQDFQRNEETTFSRAIYLVIFIRLINCIFPNLLLEVPKN